jgi:hypothetical protein
MSIRGELRGIRHHEEDQAVGISFHAESLALMTSDAAGSRQL